MLARIDLPSIDLHDEIVPRSDDRSIAPMHLAVMACNAMRVVQKTSPVAIQHRCFDLHVLGGDLHDR